MAASGRAGLVAKLARRLLLPLLVISLMLMPPAPTSRLETAWAWSLPSLPGRQTAAGTPQPLAPAPPGGRLQEVPPPVAVQQLQQALAEHLPQITISSPRDGATLADGPWTLKLKLRDWPLADAGPLGLGAHVVVQIDDQPPQRVTAGEGQQAVMTRAQGEERELVLQQTPLTPGSHRLTVYAARPWGEAVKSPGAVRQIRLHRLAANPLSLPAVGTPQLLPVSPEASNGGEPLLLDWLLLDAPLQNLRDGDASWRLKVTINGDTFLVDQAVPLWLRGWKGGRNILQLELLDGIGEPLNPPFNSFVAAIDLAAPGADPAAKPRWLQGRLNNDELAMLLGDKPPPEPEPDIETEPETQTESDTEPKPESQSTPTREAELAPKAETKPEPALKPEPETELKPEPQPESRPEQTLIEAGQDGDNASAADHEQGPAAPSLDATVTATMPPLSPDPTAAEAEASALEQGATAAPAAEDRNAAIEPSTGDTGSGEQAQADGDRGSENSYNSDNSEPESENETDHKSDDPDNNDRTNDNDNKNASGKNDNGVDNGIDNAIGNDVENNPEYKYDDDKENEASDINTNNTSEANSSSGTSSSEILSSESRTDNNSDNNSSSSSKPKEISQDNNLTNGSAPGSSGYSRSTDGEPGGDLSAEEHSAVAGLSEVQGDSAGPEPESMQQADQAPTNPASGASPEALLGGSARELVNPDGTLMQPAAQGPLTKLRQLLQR